MVDDGTTRDRQLLNLTMVSRFENASAFHQTEWVDMDTITITLVANVVVWLLALTYFWGSRRHHPGYFSSKRYYLPNETPPDLPSRGFFSWICPLLAIPEEDILTHAGFDAVIFLRFYALAFKLFALMAPYCLLVLIPVNIMDAPRGTEDVRHASSINNFNRLSMSNIQDYDPRMWLHALGMYLLTAFAMYFLVVEYRRARADSNQISHYTNLRHKFLRRKSAHQRTIVVEGVPKEMRSTSKLFTYFNTLYPGEVIHVDIPQDLLSLRRLIRQRQSVIDSLGRGLAEKAVRGEEQYHYTGGWFRRRERVNTIKFYSRELNRLNLAIATEQENRIPTKRHSSEWGPGLQSNSTVDMNYGLGSKPDEGAGPIERVVLQEDPFEDNLSDSEGSNDRAAGPSHADSASTEGNSHSSPDDDDRSPEAKDASSKNVQAMESGVLQNGVIGGRGNGRGSRRGESVVEEDFLRGKKTLQHLQEEYWGNGYRAAREGSPRTPGEGAGWVSPSRPPRLTVDLINIDPVKEAVIHTMQTLKDMKVRSLYHSFYRGNKGQGQQQDYGSGSECKAPEARLNNSDNYSPESINGLPFTAGAGAPCDDLGGEKISLLQGARHQTHRFRPPRVGKRIQISYSSRAFVTFRSFSASTVARNVLHCARPGRMSAKAAPESRDVYWPNAIVTRRQHTIRRTVVEILVGLLMLLFPVLVTMLSFMFSAENLMQRFQVIKAMCDRSSLFQSMVELIQPMCVIAVMETLPLLLRWVGHLEASFRWGLWIQMTTLSRLFAFQILNVFLVTAIAGFAVEIVTGQVHAQIVQRLVDHPSVFFTLLGETLPKVCGFFCDYVIIRAFTGMSMELVRAYDVFPEVLGMLTGRKQWARSLYQFMEDRRQRVNSSASIASGGGVGGARSSETKEPSSGESSPVGGEQSNSSREPLHPGCFFYGQVYAQDLLVVVVVMTYANVAPVVLIPALMFFLIGYIVYKHQLLYVYVPKFESGGSFFPKVFRLWVFALFTAQAMMTGMCLLKQGYNQAYSVMFLMVLTYTFK
ncbi:unnamed protein product, partial [Ascophyllum nodosum]